MPSPRDTNSLPLMEAMGKLQQTLGGLEVQLRKNDERFEGYDVLKHTVQRHSETLEALERVLWRGDAGQMSLLARIQHVESGQLQVNSAVRDACKTIEEAEATYESLRAAIKETVKTVRSDLSADIRELKTSTTNEIATLKSELGADIKANKAAIDKAKLDSVLDERERLILHRSESRSTIAVVVAVINVLATVILKLVFG